MADKRLKWLTNRQTSNALRGFQILDTNTVALMEVIYHPELVQHAGG